MTGRALAPQRMLLPSSGYYSWPPCLAAQVVLQKNLNDAYNKMLLTLIITGLSHGLPRAIIRDCARKTFYYHINEANHMTNIHIGKWQKN